MKHFLFAFFMLPIACFAQITITGKIVSADKKAVVNASVFLSNATVGDKTNDEGAYVLRNVKQGQYELVVTIIGYETYRQTVMAGTDNISLPDIILTPRTTELKEVSIRPDPDWERKYDAFKLEFLGSSEMAKQCKILNPEMVDLDYDKDTRKLTGSSFDFIEIENKALGYHIKYLLTKFVKDSKTNMLYYEGSTLFNEMKGTSRDKKRWAKNRKLAYEGSSMQFLRGLVGNNIESYGFKALRLIRKPNTAYNGLNEKYAQTLVNVPLTATDFATLTDRKGLYALKFNDCLYVMYTKKRDNDNSIYRSLTMPNYLTTILSFTGPYALFDTNGVILTPEAVTFEGYWGKSRVAEMLPVDYTPEEQMIKFMGR
jgi:hypothetical protein